VEKQLRDKIPTAVVLADSLMLRREALRMLLLPWAEANRVSLLVVPPDEIRSVDVADVRVALALLSIGGLGAGETTSLAWLREIAASLPDAPIAIIGDQDGPIEIFAALHAGARGFVPTSTAPELALHTLTFILNGGSYFPPGALFSRSAQAGRGGNRGSGNASLHSPHVDTVRVYPSKLTPKQLAILMHLQNGMPNKTIARLLGLQESTVKVHVRQIMRKLGVNNRTQAALATLETLATAA
jgi:DNA-binding NarL/FixJ family response regulator